MMTEKQFDEWIRINNALADAAVELLALYQKIRKEVLNEDPNKFISFSSCDGQDIIYDGDETWNYGGHEYHKVELPANWLYSPDREFLIRDAANVDLRRKQQVEQASKEASERHERAKFEELKKKFGD